MESQKGAIMSHIIDDFFFVGPAQSENCGNALNAFIELADDIGFPIKHEKTTAPSTVITIYGFEVDSGAMLTRLPEDKVTKIVNALNNFCRRKKVTLKELQSLLGLLNFATAVVVPGRTFLRRLYDLTIGIEKAHYKIRLNQNARADLTMWLQFMTSFNGKCMFLSDK
jgi:hypothetical protein